MNRKTILFYGDSNIYGTKPIVNYGVMERYEEDERWTGILRQNLHKHAHIIEEGLPSRTTVHDDPINGKEKNGLTYLRPCLASHQPLDMIVMLLGTNDLKTRFSMTAFDIALSIERLILEIQACQVGPKGQQPKLLILSPAPIVEIGVFGKMMAGGAAKSQQLAFYYQKIAEKYQALFFDVGSVIKVSSIDGVHYDMDQLPVLADALLPLIQSALF